MTDKKLQNGQSNSLTLTEKISNLPSLPKQAWDLDFFCRG